VFFRRPLITGDGSAVASHFESQVQPGFWTEPTTFTAEALAFYRVLKLQRVAQERLVAEWCKHERGGTLAPTDVLLPGTRFPGVSSVRLKPS
jgi:hypothetical protein